MLMIPMFHFWIQIYQYLTVQSEKSVTKAYTIVKNPNFRTMAELYSTNIICAVIKLHLKLMTDEITLT